MMISRNDLLELFRTENVFDLEVILNAFGLSKSGCTLYGYNQKRLAKTVLSFASAHTCTVPLDARFANEIVTHIALCCEAYQLVDLVRVAAPLKFRKVKGDVQPSVRCAIGEDGHYDEDVANAITQLSEPEFLAFVSYLLANAKDLPLAVGYNMPIIQQIRKHQVIGDGLLFAYMALCLRDIPDQYRPV